MILDTSLNLFDQGLIGFASENLHKGALGFSIREIEKRRVPKGSYLLIESLDRLARDKILEQVALFTTIITAKCVG